MTRFTTDADIRAMVIETLEAGATAEDFDIDAIVTDLVAAAEYNGREFTEIPEGDDFWAIVAQNDVSGARADDNGAALDEADEAHCDLGVLEDQVSGARLVRDQAIRAAIVGGVTMYAIAKRLGITEQAVRRIRDRG